MSALPRILCIAGPTGSGKTAAALHLARALEQIERAKKLEEKALPEDIDYMSIAGLRIEARQKLAKIRPLNLGQAGRISGVNPADIAVLMVYLKK